MGEREAKKLLKLIGETSTSLPDDVEGALKKVLAKEPRGSSARIVLETILENTALAKASGTPLCQDTGTLSFYIDEAVKDKVTPEDVKAAVAEATKKGLLRKNCIDPVSGRSFDDNCTEYTPIIHYKSAEWRKSLGLEGTITLQLKGGGSENMSRQYSLPSTILGAARDMTGVRKCVLDAIFRAQGYGCAPGIIGVCIGGDRATGYEVAKEQLLRRLDDISPDPKLARLERWILKDANMLGIGPMGMGGKTTILGVKAAARPRLPASFFVTVAYMCWACRRNSCG